ncbi:hypothetical protein BDV12DRAFT_123266 [Aspergillus spectabilis]
MLALIKSVCWGEPEASKSNRKTCWMGELDLLWTKHSSENVQLLKEVLSQRRANSMRFVASLQSLPDQTGESARYSINIANRGTINREISYTIINKNTGAPYNGREEWVGQKIEYLHSQHTFGPETRPTENYRHGSGVAGQVVGKRLGICPSCTLVVTTTAPPSKAIENWHTFPNEIVLSQLIDTLDDVKKKDRQGRATINMSFAYLIGTKTLSFHTAFRE